MTKRVPVPASFLVAHPGQDQAKQWRWHHRHGRHSPFASIVQGFSGIKTPLMVNSSGLNHPGSFRPLPLAFISPMQQPSAGQQQDDSGSEESDIMEFVAARTVYKPLTLAKRELLHDGKYQVLDLLTQGRFTSLWLAKEIATRRDVIIKVALSGDYPSYMDAQREVQMLQLAGAALPDSSRPPGVVQLLDSFPVATDSGRHLCLVTEQLGDSLGSILYRYNGRWQLGMPLDTVRHISRQLLQALAQLHGERRMVHMALRPENVCCTQPFETRQGLGYHVRRLQKGWANFWPRGQPSSTDGSSSSTGSSSSSSSSSSNEPVDEGTLDEAHFKLIDFGRARQLRGGGAGQERAAPSAAEEEESVIIFGHPGYRPPEEVLALPYVSPAYDIWSLGCLTYALATGQDLFAPQQVLLDQQDGQTQQQQQQQQPGQQQQEQQQEGMTLDERHLVDMLAVLGRPPPAMVASSPLRQALYKPSGRLRVEAQFRVVQERLCEILQAEHGFDEQEATSLAEFLEDVLQYDPRDRPSAAQLLQHPFLLADSAQPLKVD